MRHHSCRLTKRLKSRGIKTSGQERCYIALLYRSRVRAINNGKGDGALALAVDVVDVSIGHGHPRKEMSLLA